VSEPAHTPGKRETKYDRWRPLYHQLAVLDVDQQDLRHAPEVIARLRELGWEVTPKVFDSYWKRVQWIADRCRGRVLEVGCGLGNVTRWIAGNPKVTAVVAVDRLADYIRTLESFQWAKVMPVCADAAAGAPESKLRGPFDTVVLAEVIEHLVLSEEVAIIAAVLPRLAAQAQWLISTPVGFMPDSDHRRGFGRRAFRNHVRALYGPIKASGDNGLQQYVACDTRGGRRRLGLRFRALAARLVAWFALLTRMAKKALGRTRRSVSACP